MLGSFVLYLTALGTFCYSAILLCGSSITPFLNICEHITEMEGDKAVKNEHESTIKRAGIPEAEFVVCVNCTFLSNPQFLKIIFRKTSKHI